MLLVIVKDVCRDEQFVSKQASRVRVGGVSAVLTRLEFECEVKQVINEDILVLFCVDNSWQTRPYQPVSTALALQIAALFPRSASVRWAGHRILTT